MRCRHYRNEGYHYEINGEDIYLCESCEQVLLSKMKTQEVIEYKNQPFVNNKHQNDIDKIKSEIKELQSKMENSLLDLNNIISRYKNIK